MKEIINGKLYNTETAKEVGWYCNNQRGFDYIEEKLFLKRTGEFFIYGHGGARTKYAERVGDCWGGGSSIVPMTEDGAKMWAEKHLTADEYIEIFGEVEE